MKNQVLLVVIGCFFLLGPPGWSAETGDSQEQALAIVEKAGGGVKRDETLPSKPVVNIQFGCRSSVTDADLACLKSFPDLEILGIHGHDVTDQGLEALKALPKLKSLTLIRVNVTDKGLDHLKGMTILRQVYIRFTRMTESGAKELGKALPDATVTWKP